MILSYSFIRDYLNCPRKAHHVFVLKDIPFTETEQMKWGNIVHKNLEDAINQNKPFSEETVKYAPYVQSLKAIKGSLEAEVKLGATVRGDPAGFFDKRSVAYRGKVDVLIGGDKEALLVDWKTGKLREDPLELEIQAFLVKANYPHLQKITGFYVWLAEGKIGKKYDLSGWLTMYKYLTNLREKIINDKEWRPTPNPLCNYCQVMTCEFRKSHR
jgi:CRISPR/Cas system-associated exonuclease Cas4 (RecB family)